MGEDVIVEEDIEVEEDVEAGEDIAAEDIAVAKFNWMVKVVPSPFLLSKEIWPLWFKMMFWVLVNPRPVPFGLLVK